MTLRLDALFVSRLAGRQVRLKPPLEKKAGNHLMAFTKESGELTVNMLKRDTVQLVHQIFFNSSLWYIQNDSISSAYPGEDAFWEQLFPLWSEENINRLWKAVITGDRFSLSKALELFTGTGWELLRWRKQLSTVRNTAAASLSSSIFTGSSVDRDCSFSVRVLVTQTFSAYIQRHLEMWRSSAEDDSILNSVLSSARRADWSWVKSVYLQISYWGNQGSISYEDGEFINRILQSENTMTAYRQLAGLYSQYGLDPLPEV